MENKLNEWTDATTYSRDDKNKRETAWHYNTGPLLIYLTHDHRLHPGKWVIVCRDVGANPAILNMPASRIPSHNEITTAQLKAIYVVKQRLQKMIASFTPKPSPDSTLTTDKNGTQLKIGDLISSTMIPFEGSHEPKKEIYQPVEMIDGKLTVQHGGSFLLDQFVRQHCTIESPELNDHRPAHK